MLSDIVINNESIIINNKMIKLDYLDNNVNHFNKIKSKKFQKSLKKKFMLLDQKNLSNKDKLKNNYEFSIHNKSLVVVI